MTNVVLFAALAIFSIVLLIILFYKKQIIIGIFSGIFLLLLGVLLWNGISYNDYTTITGNTGNYTITDHYAEWSNEVIPGVYDNQVIGTSMILLGLFLLIVSAVMIFSGKTKMDLGSLSGEEGGHDGED